MFVGHALLAFALVAGAAVLAGRDRPVALGLAAGAFATVPDVDIAHALVGVAGAGTAAPLALSAAFWEAGNVVHRAITHSLPVALPAAIAAAAWTAGRRGRRHGTVAALGLVAALALVAFAVSGPLAAAVTVLFGGALFGVATLLADRTALSPRAVLGCALVGLASHPFGDLFTGTPPAFLYPFATGPAVARVELAADPTLHLLAAFGLELATAWLAVLVLARAFGARLLPAPHAAAGAGYAAAVPVLPAPTLDLSYPFVFGALAVGLLVVLPGAARAARGRRGRRRPGVRAAVPAPRLARASLTALTGITLAWAAYAAGYLALAA
ncbi:MAG: metal-dependent hydrolase [Haloferacaceae archaeon]